MRPKFVLFGDSITQLSFMPGGWGAALTDRYARQADVMLRGYCGYNTRWAVLLLDRIFSSLASQPPLLVTVFFGANDAALPDSCSARQHVPIPEYKHNLQRIISHLKGISVCIHIVLITPPPVDIEGLQIFARQKYGVKAEELPSRTNETTGLYAKACIDVADESGVAVIDLWSIIQSKPGWQKSCLRGAPPCNTDAYSTKQHWRKSNLYQFSAASPNHRVANYS
eukprot:c23192_g1_i2 orf=284-958(+)